MRHHRNQGVIDDEVKQVEHESELSSRMTSLLLECRTDQYECRRRALKSLWV